MNFLLAEFGQKIVAAQMMETVVALPINTNGGAVVICLKVVIPYTLITA